MKVEAERREELWLEFGTKEREIKSMMCDDGGAVTSRFQAPRQVQMHCNTAALSLISAAESGATRVQSFPGTRRKYLLSCSPWRGTSRGLTPLSSSPPLPSSLFRGSLPHAQRRGKKYSPPLQVASRLSHPSISATVRPSLPSPLP